MALPARTVVMNAWLSLFLLLLEAAPSAHAQSFGYKVGSSNGPDRWGRLNPAWTLCGNGTRQSPINLPTPSVQRKHQLGPLDLEFSHAARDAVLVNDRNGRLEVELDETWGTLEINQLVYRPFKLHFHSPAEHTIHNKRFPLELHIVWRSDSQSHLAVLGVLFKVTNTRNAFISQIFRDLPKLADNSSAHIDIKALNARELHISDTSSYWRYTGSLTTPPCTEGITWTVLKEVAGISQKQLATYLKSTQGAKNSRPLQSLRGRRIYNYDTSSHNVCTPEARH